MSERPALPLLSLPLFLLALLPAAGCTRPVPTAPPTRGGAAPVEDPLVALRESLDKGGGVTAYRTAVQQTNAYLAKHPEEKPRPLTSAERELLTGPLGLDADELAEVESPAFTLLDGHHLDTCFLLRDAARSLHVDDRPPLDRATAGFAWVVRQVRLRERQGEAVPPLFVLRRGWGTPLERAQVFLALLDQLGVPGCMLALPGEGEGARPRYSLPGALVEQDIYLFDTRMNLPLPAPDGKGIATLAQVRSQADPFRPLQVDDKLPYDVTAAQAKQAIVLLPCPLSALAPRMRFLEGVLPAHDRAVLSLDVVARRDQLRAGAAGADVRLWGGRDDPQAPTRQLRSFLPAEEGGSDRSQRFVQYMVQSIPWEALPQVARELPGEPGQRLQEMFRTPFVGFLLNPKMPRDLILRGRQDEATPQLVATLDQLRRSRNALESMRGNLGQQIQEWAGEAVTAYGELLRAEREANLPPGKAPPGAQTTLANARQRVERLWKEGLAVQVLVAGAAAEPLTAEMTYLLALCKHEQAERAEARRRAGRGGSAADAWKPAADWWETYLEEFPAAPDAPHARWHKARALEALGERAAAASLLQNMTGNLTPLERLGRLYRARQLKTS